MADQLADRPLSCKVSSPRLAEPFRVPLPAHITASLLHAAPSPPPPSVSHRYPTRISSMLVPPAGCPRWCSSPRPLPFPGGKLPPRASPPWWMAGPSGFEPELQAPQACVLSRLDHGPSLLLPGGGLIDGERRERFRGREGDRGDDPRLRGGDEGAGSGEEGALPGFRGRLSSFRRAAGVRLQGPGALLLLRPRGESRGRRWS